MADVRRLPGPNADLWDWQLHGACRGMDSAFFFHPDGERGPARASRERRAKAVCESCPVMEPCRRHALAAGEPYGIWGGLSESERSAAAGGRRSGTDRDARHRHPLNRERRHGRARPTGRALRRVAPVRAQCPWP